MKKNIFWFVILIIVNLNVTGQTFLSKKEIDNAIENYYKQLNTSKGIDKHMVFIMVFSRPHADTIRFSISYMLGEDWIEMVRPNYIYKHKNKYVAIRTYNCKISDVAENSDIKCFNLFKKKRIKNILYPSRILISGIQKGIVINYVISKHEFTEEWFDDADLIPNKYYNVWRYDYDYIQKVNHLE